MLPTLVDGQPVLVLPARLAPPREHDVVVARPPQGHPDRGATPAEDRRPWIKRVAAVGPCVHALDAGFGREVEVPADHVLLLGDNPAASTDGRHVGPTPLADVTHRVVWPGVSGRWRPGAVRGRRG